MKVEIKIDKATKEEKILIITSKVDEEIMELVNKISALDNGNKNILGYKDSLVEIIPQKKYLEYFQVVKKFI